MTATTLDELIATAERWASDDPDATTRDEAAALVAARDEAALRQRFASGLEFGTAGLRGLLGAGPNRMNEKVVIRATAGLCAHVLSAVPNAAERGICVAFDGRRKSREFAELVGRVALGAGLRVHAFAEVVPTPVLAFACLHRQAAAGVMVTASHNPPDYNGYKVFWDNGAQIISPTDAAIASAIEQVGPLAEVPEVAPDDAGARHVRLGRELELTYLDGVDALPLHRELPRDVTIAYTALHGVGDRLAREALGRSGFEAVYSVAEQAEPDGAFPTVAFPNPEEEGAMDMVLALAAAKSADLVIANDPDADRLAVAVPDGQGGYAQLSGNDVGCLLAHYLLTETPPSDRRLVVNTIVSSPMLGAIAEAHGARWEQTLTGFKWIANRALALADEADFVLGYEEALGYTVGGLVRDKDGVGAAVVFADFAAWCKSRGVTVLAELEATWRRYGMFQSRQVSRVLPGEEGRRQIDAMMAGVRQAPPTAIGGFNVLATIELLRGERTFADGRVEALALPPGNVVAYELEGGHRVMLRPSGTEPKLKSYFDVRVDLEAGESKASAVARADVLLDALEAGLNERLGR